MKVKQIEKAGGHPLSRGGAPSQEYSRRQTTKIFKAYQLRDKQGQLASLYNCCTTRQTETGRNRKQQTHQKGALHRQPSAQFCIFPQKLRLSKRSGGVFRGLLVTMKGYKAKTSLIVKQQNNNGKQRYLYDNSRAKGTVDIPKSRRPLL